jgi:thymidylate synthase ThyX
MADNNKPLRVYTLDGLPPEVAAVTFAKTSRVADSFDEIAKELSEADSSRFHEKWVIGYGHSSVAEHAVLSVAIENVSILGAKVIEENRLSSFTERSTRYQVMDPESHYTPPAFGAGRPGEVYRESLASLYAAYEELMPRADHFCLKKYSGPEWREKGVAPTGKACDMVRGLLPAAAKTNLGWTVNARSLRYALVKMASHPLLEMREIGAALEAVCREKLPTLLKYTQASRYLEGWEGRMAEAAEPAKGCGPGAGGRGGDKGRRDTRRDGSGTDRRHDRRGGSGEPSRDGVRLVAHDPEGEADVLAAILFRATGRPYEEIRKRVSELGSDAVGSLLADAVRGVGPHDVPVREFENTGYTFEIVCDFGAYRDIQRHRLTTQTQQILGCDLGYAIPDDAREAGLAARIEEALESARRAHLELAAVDPVHAQYAVPLAFNKRFLMTMNFREAYHFVQLRSRSQGHESYRRVAWAVKREIERVHPALGTLIPAEGEPVGERTHVAGLRG